MSLVLGIAIGVAACVIALALIYRNNEKWFAANSAKLDAILAKLPK